MKYVKIDKVLAYITPSIRRDYSDMDLLFNANTGFKSLDMTIDTEIVCCILPIKNNKVKTPSDLKYIDRVYYTDKLDPNFPCEHKIKCKCGVEVCDNFYIKNDDEFCNSCNSCIETSLGFTTRTNNICKHTLAHQVFLDYIGDNKHSLRPMSYVGNTRNKVAKDCIAGCKETFSMDVNNNLIVDKKEGWVSIVYRAAMKDGNSFLVPDDDRLLRGLATFAEAYAFKDKATNEPKFEATYERRLIQAENLLKSYRSNRILAAINIEEIDAIVGRNTNSQRILRHGHKVYKGDRGRSRS